MNPGAMAVVFVLSGMARVQVSPFPVGDHPGEMRVTLEPARAPGHVSVRLESRGYSCVLEAWTPSAPVRGTVTSSGSGPQPSS